MKNNVQISYQPNLKETFLLTLILLLGGGMLQGIIVGVFQLLGWGGDFLQKVIGYLLLFVPVILFLYRRTGRWLPFWPSWQSLPRYWQLYPVLLLLIPTINVLLEIPLAWFPMPDWYIRLMENLSGGPLWITLLSVAVLAPLLEEYFCRGVIMRGLLSHTRPAQAILWSSFVFAIIHLNLWQAIPAFAMGAVFGWVYYRTGSLWTTIFLHAVNNALSILVSHNFPELSPEGRLTDLIPVTPWIMYGVCALLLVASLYFIHRYTKTTIHHEI